MKHRLNLDYSFPTARDSDPETSHQGMEGYNLTERRLQVLSLLSEYPGTTSGELAGYFYKKHPGLGIRCAAETPHKRLPELEIMDLVVRCEPRRCRDSGKPAATWVLSGRGMEVLEDG